MTLVYIYRKICEKRAKELNEQVSHSLIKKRPAKKDEKLFGKKKFWAAVAAEGVQGGLAHGRKGADDNWRGKSFQSCFLLHTPRVFCAVGARPPRLARTAAATTAATAATAITGVVRLCNATRYGRHCATQSNMCDCRGMRQCKGGWGGLDRARDLEEKRLFSLFHTFFGFFFNF